MKQITEYSVYTVVFLLIMTAVGTYLAPHAGWRVDAVTTGSMAPALKVGSVVIVEPVAPEEVREGDIITFRLNGVDDTVVTHRVTRIGYNSPLFFKTKGDANTVADPFTVPSRDLVGKVIVHLPLMGHLVGFLKTICGFLLVLLVPGMVIIGIWAWNAWKELYGKRKARIRIASHDS